MFTSPARLAALFVLPVLLLAQAARAQTYTLNVSRSGNGSGQMFIAGSSVCPTSCSPSFAAGTIVQVTAIGSPGSTFSGWAGACTGLCPCFIPMNSSQTVIANFTLNTSAISIAFGGTGSGTITSAPTGLSCSGGSGTCTASFATVTPVTLTATPDANSVFTGWSGTPCQEGTSSPHCTFFPLSTTTVTANFTATAFPLTVVQTGTGSGITLSNPPGITCPTTCTAMFPAGSTVRISPIANPGDTTISISGGGPTCTGPGSCDVLMDGPKTLTVRMDHNSYSISIQRQGPGSVSVSTFPPGISCTPAAAPQSSCTAFFPFDTLVQVTAIPAPGTIFEGFTGAESSSGNVAFVRTNFYRSLTIRTRCATDFNASGAADVTDIFDFLAAWFAGCP